jgi:hypothetical protein
MTSIVIILSVLSLIGSGFVMAVFLDDDKSMPFNPRRFEPLPVVQVMPGKRPGAKLYKVFQPFAYHSDFTPWPIEIPAGYESDGASVPRLFWRLFPPSGPWTGAAIVHDWLCDTRELPSKTAHAVFDEAMRDLGVAAFYRVTMGSAVRWFGPRW